MTSRKFIGDRPGDAHPYGSVDAGLKWHGGRLLGISFLVLLALVYLGVLAYFIGSLQAREIVGAHFVNPRQFPGMSTYETWKQNLAWILRLIVAILMIIYVPLLPYRLLLFFQHLYSQETHQSNDDRIEVVPDDKWPHYTVLVALYKEATIVQRLVNNLAHLQYPNEKLTILLLVEESEESPEGQDDDGSPEPAGLIQRLFRFMMLPLMPISVTDRMLLRMFGDPKIPPPRSADSGNTREAAEKAINKLKDSSDQFLKDRANCFQVQEVPKPTDLQKRYIGNSEPTTKPRALNYGLYEGDGTVGGSVNDFHLCTLYDAEDRPEEDQLLRVARRFYEDRNGSPNDTELVCVQCRLAYENFNDNWIISLFKAEYSAWFNILLPSLYDVNNNSLVIPLGGTSNHFLVDKLRDIGGWDSFNVTEDCDLGVWISRNKNSRNNKDYRIEIEDSITWEIANGRLEPWIRQRSRWIKGYIQTFFVHMQRPDKLFQELGPKRFFSFQWIIGSGFLLPLINPLFWILTTLYVILLVLHDRFVPARLPFEIVSHITFPSVLPWGTASFFISNVIFFFFLSLGHIQHPKRGSYRWIIMWWWLYWVMMSWAAVIAAWQYITNPAYWEKSDHTYVRT